MDVSSEIPHFVDGVSGIWAAYKNEQDWYEYQRMLYPNELIKTEQCIKSEVSQTLWSCVFIPYYTNFRFTQIPRSQSISLSNSSDHLRASPPVAISISTNPLASIHILLCGSMWMHKLQYPYLHLGKTSLISCCLAKAMVENSSIQVAAHNSPPAIFLFFSRASTRFLCFLLHCNLNLPVPMQLQQSSPCKFVCKVDGPY